MIRLAPRRGRPARRPILCYAPTPRAAVRVVRHLRTAGIAATWVAARPYTVRVAAGDLDAAAERLRPLLREETR